MQTSLLEDLKSTDRVVLGNAIALLGILKRKEVVPSALAKALDRNSDFGQRHSGVVAVVNAGSRQNVPELLAGLNKGDPAYLNILDAACSLVDETQFDAVFPLMFSENAMLSSTFYHFRELRSREVLVKTLTYFERHIDQLNSTRPGAYVEPILQLLPNYFDRGIAQIVARLLVATREAGIYPDRSAPLSMLFEIARGCDHEAWVFKEYTASSFESPEEEAHQPFFVEEIVAAFLNLNAAKWLVEKNATDTIKRFAGYLRGPVREFLKPYSGGLIESQEQWAAKHRDEEDERRLRHEDELATLRRTIRENESLDEVLGAVLRLREEHLPEVDNARKIWMGEKVSARLVELNLRESIQWKDNTLWLPTQLGPLLTLVSHYQLPLDPDSTLVDALMGWDSGGIPKYYKKYGFSAAAIDAFEASLENPPSAQGLEALVRFIHETDIWSDRIEAGLKKAMEAETLQDYVLVLVLETLTRRGLSDDVLENFAANAKSSQLRDYAFQALIERQHRPTIERNLSRLLDAGTDLSAGEVGPMERSPLNWISKIRSEFAWDKLAKLRSIALQKNQPTVVGLLTDTLARTNKFETAKLVERQVKLAPVEWQHVQQAHAIRLEAEAKIEKAQSAPLAQVLQRLQGTTSLNLLLVFCEGSSDIPVFRTFLNQIRDVSSEVKFNFVGGWSQLPLKDPSLFMLGCKAAIVVMDGDEGRNLTKRNRPLTTTARREKTRLAASGVELFVLNRYGIENYFSKQAMESVMGRDLTAYFPLSEDISVVDQLAEEFRPWSFRIRRFLSRALKLSAPAGRKSLYSKARNQEVAEKMNAAEDLNGTDLLGVLQRISSRVQELQYE
jgi:hypothetical protein